MAIPSFGKSALTKSEKIEIVDALRDFVLRVSSPNSDKQPEEIAILPTVVKILFEETYLLGLSDRETNQS